MKKKILTIFFALVAALCLCFGLAACGEEDTTPAPTPPDTQTNPNGDGGGTGDDTEDGAEDDAETGTEGLQYQKRKDEDDKEYFAVVGLGTSEDIDIVIPASYEGLPVKEIGNKAFSSSVDARNASLTSISIPNSVTEIAREAFSGCSGLKSVTIGRGVTSIGSYAFENCTGLQSVIWNAENCTTTGSYSIFEDLTSLKTVTFGKAVKNIPARTFEDCTGLTSVTLPDSVTSIGSSAFSGCGLTSVTIPDSVTSIGDQAFSNSGLKSITVGANNKNYSSQGGILYNKAKTQIIEVPLGIQGEVTVPDSVTAIGEYAFSHCSGLKSVTIGSGSIGGSAFYGCTGLKSVTIGSGVTSIGASAFSGCTGLTSATIGSGSIGASAFYGCNGLTSVTIESGVTSIGDRAFDGCHKLIEVWNYSGLTLNEGDSDNGEIAENAIHVYTDHTPSKQTVKDDYLFYEEGNEVFLLGYVGESAGLILPTASPSGKSYKIYRYAFYACYKLTGLTIWNGVTEIGDFAFYGCNGLTGHLEIPDSVISIGYQAFANCTGLTSVTIGSGVTSIGMGAFFGCYKLKSAQFKNPNGWFMNDGKTPVTNLTADLLTASFNSFVRED